MVIALDKHKKPLGFITERRCRILMERHRVCLYRVFPAIVILKDKDCRDFDVLPTFRIKIDPGSKHTGIAIVCNETNEVMFYMQIEHRGEQIHKNKQTQQQVRRNRRSRETRYRRCKFNKGTYDSDRKEGWLPPSVKSIADNVIAWVNKLSRYIRITQCSFEAVRFDTQLMDNPDIEGEKYQQGELFGYELREYLLDKYGHQCQYCHGASEDSILEWEHIIPKSRGGSDSVKNAVLSCSCCNREKGKMTADEWLAKLQSSPSLPSIVEKKKNKILLTDKEKLLLARIEGIKDVISGKIKKSNRYCAWVNSTRRTIEKFLFSRFTNVECSSGGRTKYNRIQILQLPKDHHYDALCVGDVPQSGYKDCTNGYFLYAKAMGRGTRLRGNVNACGIITTKFTDRSKTYQSFMTGDIVQADVPDKYKYHGHMVGRIAIRKSGYFNIWPIGKKCCNVKVDFCKPLQKQDGYSYEYRRQFNVRLCLIPHPY